MPSAFDDGDDFRLESGLECMAFQAHRAAWSPGLCGAVCFCATFAYADVGCVHEVRGTGDAFHVAFL